MSNIKKNNPGGCDCCCIEFESEGWTGILNPKWANQISGSWSIDGHGWLVTSTTNAKLIHNDYNHSTFQVLNVTLMDRPASTVSVIYFCWLDSNNHFKLVYEYKSLTFPTRDMCTVYSVVGGTETSIISFSVNYPAFPAGDDADGISIKICAYSGIVLVNLSRPVAQRYYGQATGQTFLGGQVGFGSINGTTKFASFNLVNKVSDTNSTYCSRCSPVCTSCESDNPMWGEWFIDLSNFSLSNQECSSCNLIDGQYNILANLGFCNGCHSETICTIDPLELGTGGVCLGQNYKYIHINITFRIYGTNFDFIPGRGFITTKFVIEVIISILGWPTQVTNCSFPVDPSCGTILGSKSVQYQKEFNRLVSPGCRDDEYILDYVSGNLSSTFVDRFGTTHQYCSGSMPSTIRVGGVA